MRQKRQQSPHMRVAMEIWSADKALMARVDAAAWLRCVPRDELSQVIASDWSGHGMATPLVRFYAARDEEVAILTHYATEARTELCFRVDKAAALGWLGVHRPAVVGPSAQAAAVPGRSHGGGSAPSPPRR